jgi:hemerythrin
MYMEIKWNTAFETGLADIDLQHRYFFGMILEYHQNLQNTEKLDQLIIPELIRYTKYHFLCEEGLMQIYSCPGLREHKSLHQQILEDMVELYRRVRLGKATYEKLLLFLFNWFSNHTTLEDQIYAQEIIAERKKCGLSTEFPKIEVSYR